MRSATGPELAGMTENATVAPSNTSLGGSAGGEHWLPGTRRNPGTAKRGQVVLNSPTVPAEPTVVHGRDGSAAQVYEQLAATANPVITRPTSTLILTSLVL